jgi:hypothetical protein
VAKHGECSLVRTSGGCKWREYTTWKTGADACDGWWSESPGRLTAGPRCILSDQVNAQRERAGSALSAEAADARPDALPTVDDSISLGAGTGEDNDEVDAALARADDEDGFD